MHYVSLLIEFLRGRPAVVFWTVALTQAALWTFIPALFYSAPPGEVPMLLAIGHEFVLGSYLGPPLAFWLGEIAFRIAGAFGLYALAQACIVLAYWAVFRLGCAIVGIRHAVLAVLLMVGHCRILGAEPGLRAGDPRCPLVGPGAALLLARPRREASRLLVPACASSRSAHACKLRRPDPFRPVRRLHSIDAARSRIALAS